MPNSLLILVFDWQRTTMDSTVRFSALCLLRQGFEPLTMTMPPIYGELNMTSESNLSAFFSVFFVSLWLNLSLHFRRISPSQPHQYCQYWRAADIREHVAAFVPFQRHQPSFPPRKFVNSAGSPVLPARHFGGCIAYSAFCAFS